MISKAITIESFDKPINSLGKSNIEEWSISRKGMSNTIEDYCLKESMQIPTSIP